MSIVWRVSSTPYQEANASGSAHHADELMRCAACGVAWPCQPYLETRAVDRRSAVVYPEHPGEVAGNGSGTAAPLRAGRPGPRFTP